MKKSLAVMTLLLMPLLLSAQGRIFTRKIKLEDFTQKTTKVVTEYSPLGMALQEEVSSIWLFSAYEFCTKDFFEKNSGKPSHYYVFLRTQGEFEWLVLRKGGQEKDPDPLKAGFDVVCIPVSPAGGPYDEAAIYMAGYVDILQKYIMAATESDSAAYAGIASLTELPHRRAILRGDEALMAFAEGRENAIAEFTVAPAGGNAAWQYRIGTDNHALYGFKKVKWKNR